MADGELGKAYADGDIIFREGDPGDCMFVIQFGQVRITKMSEEGEIPIVTLKTGEIFGEMALFDRLPRSATAVAEGEARLLSVDKKKLFLTIQKDPTVVLKILETMSGTIRRLSRDFTVLKEKKTDALAVCTDVEGICELILTEVRKHMDADHGSVMLLKDDGKTFDILAAFGTKTDIPMALTADEGVAGDILRTGKAELINNVEADIRFVPGVGTPIRSMLCVPLQCEKRTFGVLNLSRETEAPFSMNDLKLLRSFSVHGAIALRNAIDMSGLSHAADEVLEHASILGIH